MNSLVSVIFKNSNRFDINRKDNIGQKVLSVLSFIIVFGFIASVMVISSYFITKRLIDINQSSAFIAVLILMNYFALFTKGIFESLNVLYFSKDLRIFHRMPIKSKDIVNAKLLNMIFPEYEMELIMLAIPMVVYGIMTKATILFYLYMIAILIIIPVIPILFTSFIISIIMRFTNKIKNKSKAMYITIILAVIVLSISMFWINTKYQFSVLGLENIIMQENGLTRELANNFILLKPVINTIINYNNTRGLVNLITYVIENIVSYIFIVYIISKIYLKGAIGTNINSKTNSKVNKNSIEQITFKKRNIKIAYISKEIKTLIRTPIFFIQCLIIPIIYPISVLVIATILIQIISGIDINIFLQFQDLVTNTFLISIFLIISQIFYMLSFSSIIAVSRDSRNAILMKYIPIKLEMQFYMKILIGVLINTITSLVMTIICYIITKDVIFALILFTILMLLNLVSEKIKLLIDLKRPQINWDSEYTMMKQNTNVLYELFYTLIVIGIILILVNMIKELKLFVYLLTLILIISNTILNEYIKTSERKIFKEIH